MNEVRVQVSPEAEADLSFQSAWYAANVDTDVAQRYLRAFDNAVNRIRRMPTIGSKRHFKHPRLRALHSISLGGSFDVHLLFYHVGESVVTVARVIHGHRDLPRRLLQPPGAED